MTGPNHNPEVSPELRAKIDADQARARVRLEAAAHGADCSPGVCAIDCAALAGKTVSHANAQTVETSAALSAPAHQLTRTAATDEVTPARAMEAATTWAERSDHMAGERVADCYSAMLKDALGIDGPVSFAECVRLVKDRDRLRREASLALDAATQLRRVHAELGRLIETMDVLLKETP